MWQTDFSEFETTAGGMWCICAVIDYATTYCLAAAVTPTSRGQDALACLHQAVGEAQRLLAIPDLRTDRDLMPVHRPDESIVGYQPAPIAVVSDNGPCLRGKTYQTAFAGPDALLRPVRTRVRSPQTNGIVERFFGTLKYEFLYRAEISDGDALGVETTRFRHLYNTVRPHQGIGYGTSLGAHLSRGSGE